MYERPVASDALLDSERTILALFDEGRGPQDIVKITGYSERTVGNVCRMYAFNDTCRHERRTIKGSQSLAKAIRATGRQHV